MIGPKAESRTTVAVPRILGTLQSGAVYFSLQLNLPQIITLLKTMYLLRIHSFFLRTLAQYYSVRYFSSEKGSKDTIAY